MAKNWYVIRVISGRENRVLEMINTVKENGGFPTEVGLVHIPTEMVMTSRNGKQYAQKRRLLPGYILLEIEMPDIGWRSVVTALRAIDGVIGFASMTSAGDKPQTLTEEEAKGLLQYSKEENVGRVQRARQVYHEGEVVNVIDGPFNSFTGTIDEIDMQKSQLRVSVEIFGRVTPIELKFNQVAKV